jgi:predicted SAM-dependent methyltransferase
MFYGNGTMMVLNLGAGNRIIEGAINHDVVKHRPEIDVVCDLNELPWPWEDETFDKVIALSVLEHLRQNLLTSMDEIWRIAKPGGVAVVKLPHWKANITWEDLTHLHMVGAGAMDQLDPRTKRGHDYFFYTPRKWRIDKQQMNSARTSIHWTMSKMPLSWYGRDDGEG